MSTETPTHVALVDDYPAILAGLSLTFAHHKDLLVCGTARSTEAAYTLIHKKRPQIAVVDPLIANGNGLTWVVKLMSELPALKIVVYTFHSDERLLRRALEIRAPGYVSKNSEIATLIEAVRTVRSGGTHTDPLLVDVSAPRTAGEASKPGIQMARISKRELETLRLTALGYGIKEIADGLGVSAKSVETFKLRGAGKLNLKSRAAIVRYAIANGWFSNGG